MITIRPATAADADAVSEFLQPFVDAQQVLPRTNDEIRGLLKHGFLADHDGALVGVVAIEIYSRKLAEIQCLAVSPHHQRNGIGTRLINECVLRARQEGVREVMAITASESLFKGCGFDYALPDQKRALFYHPRD
jgi:N-acetylglutamate synthase-like GNAT family acetyltransferase